MSSSLAAQNSSTNPIQSGSSQGSHLGASRNPASSNTVVSNPLPSQFREIHKNTWLKRLTAEGKKITVGAKKSERNWVVFCVHDDTIALLEGYAEPRQTGAHMPEWIIPLQDTLHISHALIPNSHEFEFVVTLSNEVIRFHAMSWDIMQEWVTTLRSKLREMKIISPRENLYTKLPEVRPPLLPTRDPTSPLPAPPPVPAAIVPGVERVIPQSSQVLSQENSSDRNISETNSSTNSTTSSATTSTNSSRDTNPVVVASTTTSSATAQLSSSFSSSTPNITAMSNTLSQNLLNLLSDPITAYSEQINESSANEDSCSDTVNLSDDEFLSPILRKSCAQLLQNENIVRNLDMPTQRSSADHIKNLDSLLQCERLIPRPQTSRSHSVGSADKNKKQTSRSKSSTKNSKIESEQLTLPKSDHVTDIEIKDEKSQELKPSSSSSSSSPTVVAKPQSVENENNVTIIQVSTNNDKSTEQEQEPPKLPIKTNCGEIFKFPEIKSCTTALTSTPKPATSKTRIKQHEYKSNVQIIPSNTKANSSTIQVLSHEQDSILNASLSTTTKLNDYSIPVKNSITVPSNCGNVYPTSSANLINNPSSTSSMVTTTSTTLLNVDQSKITTVRVAGSSETQTISSTSVAVYGTCFATPTNSKIQQDISSPKLPKKVILSANTSGVTNISVNNNDDTKGKLTSPSEKVIRKFENEATIRHNVGSLHYEKVFLSSSTPIVEIGGKERPLRSNNHSPNLESKRDSVNSKDFVSSNSDSSINPSSKNKESPRIPSSVDNFKKNASSKSPSPKENKNIPSSSTSNFSNRQNAPSHSVSPALRRRHLASSANPCSPPPNKSHNPALPEASRRFPLLTRGLTEAAITSRPSRKDLYNLKMAAASKASPKSNSGFMSNNNEESNILPNSSGNAHHTPLMHAMVNRTNSELIEQRKRSSSTSDAQTHRNKLPASNNNDFVGSSPALRIQQPPLPFRSVENGMSSVITTTATANNSPAGKRMTLREQQVMQIRREIRHPAGVRLQLRRKDCVGSIAWVDAFGAVWVAGWKQKEHPVLYNALHIGDQLLSIAGVAIGSAAEANKIIRNTNTLFIEVLVRRIPFGRAYAIRRDREGQCLGLIRDGNTATIVDVVPNSLAARHGLPPKAQSCDATTLTFWVLTEINGRPLNLFFKDTEIRDRLNSVGRDISILVQPSDLIAKLKKQLKSLRGYKDYLVQ